MCKPFLKWVGGKTQILEKVIDKFPAEMKDYHEPFLGGGSVLFGLLTHAKNKEIFIRGKVYAYDLNEPLIHTYKNIQRDYLEVYSEINKLINKYNSLNEKQKEVNLVFVDEKGKKERNKRTKVTLDDPYKNKETYYYWLRSEYNKLEDKKTVYASALFIFLNKTCFRGVHRVGPNGFNVPYGNYKNPEIVSKEHLKEVSELIKDVIFECLDYKDSLKNVKPGSFIYMDPPYVPENEKSFVGYTDKGFYDHSELFNLCGELKHVKFVMSNSINAKEYINNANYKVYEIECKRSINSDNPGSKTNEVIICN